MTKPDLPRDARPMLLFTAGLTLLLIGAFILLVDATSTNLLPAMLIGLSVSLAILGVISHLRHERKVREFLSELRQSNLRRKTSG